MAIKIYPTGNYQVHFDDGLIIEISVNGGDSGFIAPTGAAYITTSNARLYFKDKKITGVFSENKEDDINDTRI